MTDRTSFPRWLGRRLLLALPVVAGVTVLTFVLIHAAPGDPIYLLAGDGGDAAYYAEMRAKYGLDRSLAGQLARYVRAVATADLGYSFMYHAPVARVLLDHLPASLLLGATALLLAASAGVAAGTAAAAAPSRVLDAPLRVATAVAYAAPVFWTGQVLMLLLSVRFGLLPVGGLASARAPAGAGDTLDVARHLILPAITLALPLAAGFARVTRASMLEHLREPFVLAAASRGLPRRRVVLRHVAPHALVPIVAMAGHHAAHIVAGAALTEALFGWPGLGYLVLHASLHRDYPLVTGSFLLISTGVVLCNAAADALCARLDPRIRLT